MPFAAAQVICNCIVPANDDNQSRVVRGSTLFRDLQVGGAFRNEIAPRQGLLRVRCACLPQPPKFLSSFALAHCAASFRWLRLSTL